MIHPKHDDHKHKNAERILKQGGYSTKIGTYAKGGAVKHDDKAEDEKLVKSMVKKKDLKPEHKKDGGFVHGGMPKKRLDKISRQTAKGDANTSMPFPTGKEKFAKGGHVKGKGKTQVNVIIGNHGQPPAQPVPVPVGGAPMPPPRPPMAPPMGGAMPPPGAGAPPAGIPMPMRAKGGSVPKMEAGAGGGLGRLEKRDKYGIKAKN